MSEFVPASHVILDNASTTVDEVLQFLAQQAVEAGIASDADAVFESFKAREAEGTTGMMGGFAIPHAKSSAVSADGVFVVKFAQGVAWPSMDDQPITCAIALLSPVAEAGTTHLSMLSKVAVMLMDAEFRTAVLEASDTQAIADLINKGLDVQ